MKITKMWLDGKPNQNPLNTTRHNRNAVFNKQQLSVINEDGNLIVDSYGDPKKVLGVIVLDNNDFVVFVKRSVTNSEIGYVDSNQRYRTVRSDDRLKFSLDRPIHGTFQRNSKGERIVVYTDGTEDLRYENLDVFLGFNSIKVFSDSFHPDIVTSVEVGGDLPTGAWYPIIQYEKTDKVVTSWIKDYNPVYIVTGDVAVNPGTIVDPRQGSPANVISNKQIRLIISNPDARFDKIKIGAVFQANNTRAAYYIKSINIVSGQAINTVISGFGEMTPITLDEVIIDRSKYKTVKHITQLSNTLYLQDLQNYKEPDTIQNGINNIRFRFKHTLLNIYSGDRNFRDHYRNNQQRHFQHGEVYAMYARLEWPWGWGQWRHIPGREARAGETAPSFDGFQLFQTGDTCSTDGTLGFWQNEDELYPTGKNYPSGKVRHIKFPSLRWMKQNIYSGVPDFGGRKMSILNLEIVPGTFDLTKFTDCYGNRPINFQIGYAKRNQTTGLIAGQSIGVGSMEKVGPDKTGYKSFGLNMKYQGGKPATENNTRFVRTYDFVSLFNKVAPNINYIRSEFELRATVNVKNHEKAPSPYEIQDNLFSINADFAANNNVIIPPQDNISKVRSTKFVINNTKYGNINNTFLEDTVLIELENPIFMPAALITDGLDETPNFDVYTHLITYLSLKKNCYNEFFNQTIITCNELGGVYGGDTYIGLHNINTFGDLPWLEDKFSNDTAKSDTHNTTQNGVRVAQQFVAESRFNTSFRYSNPGTLGGSTQYMPYDDYIIYLPALLRDQEPNSFNQGYTQDYNAQNDLTFSNVYNPNIDIINHERFAVTRGAPISAEGDIGEWLNFKINDIYYLDKTRGDVVFFGAAKDFLIIHHRNALFRTRERTQLETAEGQAVFTGQGDIFAHDPEEVVYDERGALGTQHRWACYMSKYGYFWIDAEAKKIYRYDGRVTDMAANGLSNFFIENLDLVSDNPFNSYGYHVVIDEKNQRLLVTKKSMKLKPEFQKSFKGVWKSDKNFLNSLKNGDIVFKEGNFIVVN